MIWMIEKASDYLLSTNIEIISDLHIYKTLKISKLFCHKINYINQNFENIDDYTALHRIISFE